MKHSALPLLICALMLLAACAPQPAATTAPGVTPEPTLAPQPSATPIPQATPTPDPYTCLNGDWLLNTEQATQLMAYITSNPSLTFIEGGLRLRFEDGGFVYHSEDLVLQISFLNGFIQARANIFVEGTTAIEGDILRFNQTNINNELTDWKALDAQGNALPLVFANTPVMAFEVADQATFSCAGDRLALTFEVEDLAGQTFDLERVK